jgi:3-methylcrotonyl-CoA carboxylase alpha subunit
LARPAGGDIKRVMFSSVLIANRGEIACRIIRTARAMGMRTVAVYSQADRYALHVEMADEAVAIGGAPARESYLRGDAILRVARDTGAECVHPGYGFLAENASFAEACAMEGVTFVGPPVAAIRTMGLKDEAKALMRKADVPVLPGFEGDLTDTDSLAGAIHEIGFPLMVKAVAGGGGTGMRRINALDALQEALEEARRESEAAFGDARVMIEKCIDRPRHIEVQILADSQGNCVHLFERDCSLQRRHQKIIEEAPAPGMPEGLREAMTEAAVAAARAVDYTGAGTVEFLVEGNALTAFSSFYFLEKSPVATLWHGSFASPPANRSASPSRMSPSMAMRWRRASMARIPGTASCRRRAGCIWSAGRRVQASG